MERMRLGEIGGRLAGMLSGGQKQRLGARLRAAAPAAACCSSTSPPPASIPAARRLFWEIIRGLAADGTTIIVTTHYMDEAERFDRLAFLSRGRLTAIGTPAEVQAYLRRRA